MNSKKPLVVIVGPTAAGKTALGLNLAQAFNGEIVAADSRTIYRDMDIGTAKPTREEQGLVRHHLLDVADPGERLSAAAFKILADSVLEDIWSRGRVPFLVGGSGLYIDAVLFDYQFPPPADMARRQELEALADDELRELLAAEDPEAYGRIDIQNRRRLIRALETIGERRGRSEVIRASTLVLGLTMSKEVAQTRIEQRIQEMIKTGLVEEVRQLGERYGWESEAWDVIGYRAFKGVVTGKKTLELAKEEFAQRDLRLWKKQMTWFKRNSAIVWLESPIEAAGLVKDFLTKEAN